MGFFYSLFDFRALSNIMCSESLNKKFEVRYFFTMCTNNSDYKGSDEIIASAMGRRNLLKTNAFVLRTLVWCCKQVQCSCSVLKWFWSHKTHLYYRTYVVYSDWFITYIATIHMRFHFSDTIFRFIFDLTDGPLMLKVI